MNKTLISKNHAFLAAIGLVEGASKKTATDSCYRLGKALEYADTVPQEVTAAWQAVVSENDFLTKMLTAVRVRKGMNRTALEGHIAYSTGQSKTAEVMTGTRTIIEILKRAELLIEDNDKLVAGEPNQTSEGPPTTVTQEPVRRSTSPEAEEHTQVTVNIQIQVSVSPDDIDALGDRLAQLIRKLSRKPSAPQVTDGQ
jgi:hypothetical protein